MAATDFSRATGLTQNQLAQAYADRGSPPVLNNVFDAETGEPLVWLGKEGGHDDWMYKRSFDRP